MATETILKSVDITDKILGQNLILALEESIRRKRNSADDKKIICEELEKDVLKDFFV